jgi:hypothetical protein
MDRLDMTEDQDIALQIAGSLVIKLLAVAVEQSFPDFLGEDGELNNDGQSMVAVILTSLVVSMIDPARSKSERDDSVDKLCVKMKQGLDMYAEALEQ